MIRQYVAAVVLSLVVFLPAAGAAAQDASPLAGTPARDNLLLQAFGLPEIDLAATENEVSGVPAELAAGRYLVRLENQTADQQVGIVFFAAPAGISDEDALDGILGEGLPTWFYDAAWAGGLYVDAGQTDAVVAELAAGDWWIDIDRGTASEIQPDDTATKLHVTGELPTAADIEDAISVNLTEYSFEMPTSLAAGPHIWQISNTGAQPHFLDLQELPDGTTLDQVMDLLGFAFTGTPAAPALGLEDTRDLYATPNLSPGQTVWIEVDLAPGTYGVACFVPDQASQAPHALMGMVQVFTIA